MSNTLMPYPVSNLIVDYGREGRGCMSNTLLPYPVSNLIFDYGGGGRVGSE